MPHRAVFIVFALVMAAVLLVSGCEPEGPTPADAQVQKEPISIAYVEWARATAISHVAAEILRSQGFDVELENVANAAMWQSVASGDTDAILCAWLPATHQMFYGPEGEFSHEVVNMGPNYYGAQLGLVVPSYVDIDSISDRYWSGTKRVCSPPKAQNNSSARTWKQSTSCCPMPPTSPTSRARFEIAFAPTLGVQCGIRRWPDDRTCSRQATR